MTPEQIQREIDAAEPRFISVSKLLPADRNPRLNDDAATSLARAVEEVGWGAPVLIQKSSGKLIAGHTRLKAAQMLKLERLPALVLDVDDRRAKALQLSDNRLAELAAWDWQGLTEELGEFGLDEAEALGFDSKYLEDLAEKIAEFGPLHDREGADDERAMFDGIGFGVVVYCEDESKQVEVLKICEQNRWKCRALT